ncbi:hypothetical protein GCK72_020799 [Caenorhabditis remanei]|uniref:F-box domain-containing protein n=1 Tax=Caenorhabditis remanei TaxID=31234 RepID=A0A6A5GIJ2_CAERE|nr:hypothetical protein GCK72_020799 [Caenorhabditis remanei]KAF1754239.1 hypothetical protein GCK72_020799 [Caenorhabditis remanei]
MASSTQKCVQIFYNALVDEERLVEIFGPLNGNEWTRGRKEWEFDAADRQGKMANLLDLPDLVMSNVLGYLDLNSVLTLRKVNRGLREFVDEEKQDFKIKTLHIWLEPDNVHLELFIDEKNPIQVEYNRTEGDTTSVSYTRRTTVNLDVMKACTNDLEIILKNQKSIFREIGVSVHLEDYVDRSKNDEYEAKLRERTEPFLADLKRILGSRNHKIRTRFLRMDVIDQFQVMAVLPYLCPETLREMTLRTSSSVEGQTLEMDEIVKLEQWKRLRKFLSEGFIITEPLHHFAHFSTLLHTSMKTVNTDELWMLKEEVMTSPTPKYFNFDYCEFVDEERLVEVFGPQMNENEWMDVKKEWKFIAADGQEKVKITVWDGLETIEIKHACSVSY